MSATATKVVDIPAGHTARREHILDAAETCFVRNGFHRTSMQDLAHQAGMTASNFYRYFPSKEALIQGLAERERVRGALLVEEMERVADKRGALLAILRRYFVEVTREAAVLRLDIWSEATRNPAIAAMTERSEAEARAWFVETFTALATSPDCDPAALYGALGPVMKGILVSRAIMPSYDPAEGAAHLHALLNAGLDGRLPRASCTVSEPTR
jgi:AcrR family transcriptional regulator